MSKAILGENVLVEILRDGEYVPFICCSECSINIRPEIIETTTIGSGSGITRKVRRVDWSVSISGINSISGPGWSAFKTAVLTNIYAGCSLRMTFTDAYGNNAVFTGSVVVEHLSLNGPAEGFSEFEKEMPGNGLYTLAIDDTHPAPSTGDGVGSMIVGSTFIVG